MSIGKNIVTSDIIAKNMLLDHNCDNCKYYRFTYAGNMCFNKFRLLLKYGPEGGLMHMRGAKEGTCEWWKTK